MAAIRNSSYYEFGWTHPDVPNYGAPVHADSYSDGFPAAIDAEGYVTVPQDPGLGVTHDWAIIDAHSIGKVEVTPQ